MKRICLMVTCLAFTLSGCNKSEQAAESPMKEPIPAPFSWLMNADASADANAYSEQHDYRLIALANRGTTVVGVDDPAEQLRLKTACGIRHVEGLGDTVDKRLDPKWRKQALDYAKAFNQTMIAKCESK
ncbi:hypothetical protein NI389_04130 [Pseudoalteromonas xiamenensis]|uniref:hypothetical protein n=1 Tax=Pseudoalteromonas xiamenensis TaxID=882626 RepID=UPI0027E47EDF|nr:hypothetical protein [Pseudoalteromonas xiamenensis]WMN60601.1 hypothetical protein NI389_04130 [Pseudoalteromonas xiamenensis]